MKPGSFKRKNSVEGNAPIISTRILIKDFVDSNLNYRY